MGFLLDAVARSDRTRIGSCPWQMPAKRWNLGDGITMAMVPECIGKPVPTGARRAVGNSGLTRKLPPRLVRRMGEAESLQGLSLQMACKRLTAWFRGGTNGPVSYRSPLVASR